MGDSAATERLLEQVDRGDPSATGELMQRHRDRLRRMVAFRLDARVSARVDASDVVQEALAEAAERCLFAAQTFGGNVLKTIEVL